MIWIILSGLALGLAGLPALMTLWNMRHYRLPRDYGGDADHPLPATSVIIPARNEESGIQACVESILASEGIVLEVIVLDDDSDDRTAEIVQEIASRDERVRLEKSTALPPGWCGKQHACWTAARRASNRVLAFIDADVRLTPDAMRRAVGFLFESRAALVSGFPQEETGTLGEKLLIPLIHFVLLGYLPVALMRQRPDEGMGAGCGQWFIAKRAPYEEIGGHSAVKNSLHDGVMLPRAFRREGYMTDLFDATDLAKCRMYRSWGETWRGLKKNATEGMAKPLAIIIWTILLGGAAILPLVMFALTLIGLALGWSIPLLAVGLSGGAVVASYLPRVVGMIRFRQSIVGALLHPLGVLLLLLIQYAAILDQQRGKGSGWKGRSYHAG